MSVVGAGRERVRPGDERRRARELRPRRQAGATDNAAASAAAAAEEQGAARQGRRNRRRRRRKAGGPVATASRGSIQRGMGSSTASRPSRRIDPALFFRSPLVLGGIFFVSFFLRLRVIRAIWKHVSIC